MSSFNFAIILNLTPDSNFCQRLLSPQDLLSQMRSYEKDPQVKFFDIGAESTSPFNERISGEEERYRLQKILFPLFDEGKIPQGVGLSFDTYRAESLEMLMGKFYQKCQAQGRPLIWNDVSGKIDEDLISILHKYPKLYYVYSHNEAPSRAQSAFHRDFIPHELSIQHLLNYFELAKNTLISKGVEEIGERLYLDPCFGFSKTKEQSLSLAYNMSSLAQIKGVKGLMLGLSRKSMLREKPDDDIQVMDRRQKEILDKWHEEGWMNSHTLIRSHAKV